jgi:hypothetical protein
LRHSSTKVGVQTNAHRISRLNERSIQRVPYQVSISILLNKTLRYLFHVWSSRHVIMPIFSERGPLVLNSLLSLPHWWRVVPIRALLTLHGEICSQADLLKLFRVYRTWNLRNVDWRAAAIGNEAPLGLLRIRRPHILDIWRTDLGLQAYPLALSQGIFPFSLRLFHQLLVWSNQSPVDGVGPGRLSIH